MYRVRVSLLRYRHEPRGMLRRHRQHQQDHQQYIKVLELMQHHHMLVSSLSIEFNLRRFDRVRPSNHCRHPVCPSH